VRPGKDADVRRVGYAAVLGCLLLGLVGCSSGVTNYSTQNVAIMRGLPLPPGATASGKPVTTAATEEGLVDRAVAWSTRQVFSIPAAMDSVDLVTFYRSHMTGWTLASTCCGDETSTSAPDRRDPPAPTLRAGLTGATFTRGEASVTVNGDNADAGSFEISVDAHSG